MSRSGISAGLCFRDNPDIFGSTFTLTWSRAQAGISTRVMTYMSGPL
jgi:hypothetical protein